MPDAISDEIHLNIGVPGRIVRGAIRRGATVREALASFGFDKRLHEIRGWASGEKEKPRSLNPDDPIETDMTLLLLRPITGAAPPRELIEEIARDGLPGARVRDILLQPFDDLDDGEPLKITLVVDQKTAETLDGKAALDLIVEMQRRLELAGETRFPVLEYATRSEIESGAAD